MTSATSTKPFTRLALAILAGVGSTSLLLPIPVLAQATNIDPLGDVQTQDAGSDPLSGGSGFNVFDMIHRARLGNSRSLREFRTEQQQQLDDAAAEFRRQQLERIQTPAEAIPATPAADSQE